MKQSNKADERKKEQMGVRERLSKSLDIPPDLFGGQSLLELRGRESITLKGCGKILLYTPEEIRIALKKGCLRVCGKRLVCTSYHAGAVGIDGEIGGISFEEI
ncbi:MAG: hypothetical protein E7668_06930 [Ruminococcaceae bacterium]|nr:hypothetical protein [Oscillospiraceae bacterium]